MIAWMQAEVTLVYFEMTEVESEMIAWMQAEVTLVEVEMAGVETEVTLV